MNKLRNARGRIATGLVLVLIAASFVAVQLADRMARSTVVAYFDNTNGVFSGDDVVIQGVPVGKIVSIEPQPERAKVTFYFDSKYKVPAEAKAAILSPQLVTGRVIQLIPPYTGGPTMQDGAVIPRERTAVPVEWDQIRAQLERVAALLKPDQPGGTSTLGSFINTAADNLRGQGASIRDTVIKLSQAVSALGDHSNDLFSTFKNLSVLVSALHDSADLLEQLNANLAEVSGVLADNPNKLGQAVEDLNGVVGDVKQFVADNRDAVGTASDKLSSVTNALVASLDDIKQVLHVAPTAVANFDNIYEPANGSLTGALAVNNFANPVGFLCGAIQAASRLNSEQAAKLCVQYLAPIVKNRQYNFPPLGVNPFVGATARPNEVSYSEDSMRPDYVPPAPKAPDAAQMQQAAGDAPAAVPAGPPQPVDASSGEAVPTDAGAGLPGLMVPHLGGGS
ncbi:phospholipid/cholesterol/gamma-HCH transport system substrate-binding protein [Mycobacterium sp. OTB74]|jgi:phospholipid/cholesterol/gamma-HCH transport system substrate-binding protein|nr:phospholipid/cholesterol/gamma-HCH transport system substrate-binding protein [Mycobacterium sp. OTB74]